MARLSNLCASVRWCRAYVAAIVCYMLQHATYLDAISGHRCCICLCNWKAEQEKGRNREVVVRIGHFFSLEAILKLSVADDACSYFSTQCTRHLHHQTPPVVALKHVRCTLSISYKLCQIVCSFDCALAVMGFVLYKFFRILRKASAPKRSCDTPVLRRDAVKLFWGFLQQLLSRCCNNPGDYFCHR